MFVTLCQLQNNFEHNCFTAAFHTPSTSPYRTELDRMFGKRSTHIILSRTNRGRGSEKREKDVVRESQERERVTEETEQELILDLLLARAKRNKTIH